MLNALLLILRGLARDQILSRSRDETVQLHKAAVRIVSLFAAVVRLDNNGIGVGRVVTRLPNGLMEQAWNQRQKRAQGNTERGFGAHSASKI